MSDGCRLGCCTPEVAALPVGGWTTSDKGWKLDDRRREHVAREWREKSAQIDRMQADYPKCKLCGQAALRLDVAGLCSKIDEVHKAYRVRLGLPAVPAAPVPQRGRR